MWKFAGVFLAVLCCTPAPSSAACTTEHDCSLNGHCIAGTCECMVPWCVRLAPKHLFHNYLFHNYLYDCSSSFLVLKAAMFWVGWVLGLTSLLYMSRLTFQPLIQQPMHTHTQILKYLCFIIIQVWFTMRHHHARPCEAWRRVRLASKHLFVGRQPCAWRRRTAPPFCGRNTRRAEVSWSTLHM